eukprot:Skav235732  [mRNA]  locus=scaffold1686:66458:67677:- [translate_table: standard]
MELPCALPNLSVLPCALPDLSQRQPKRPLKRRAPGSEPSSHTVLPSVPSALPDLSALHAAVSSSSMPSALPDLCALGAVGTCSSGDLPGEVVFGGDFSGMEVAFEAAVDVAERAGASFRVSHAWSSDTDAACQKFLKSNRPGHLLPSVSDPVPPGLPAINMYVAGFPCQPWSGDGKQMGLSDDRGKLVWPMLDRLESMSESLLCFLLENTSNLATSRKHRSDLDTLFGEEARGSASTPSHEHPVPLSAFLPASPVLSPEEKERRVAELSKTGQRNLQLACADIRRSGFDPSQVLCCIDVDSGRTNAKLWKMGQARTLTRSRGGCGGPWLSSHYRRTTLREMAAFQGLDLTAYDLSGLTSRQVGQMLPGVI